MSTIRTPSWVVGGYPPTTAVSGGGTATTTHVATYPYGKDPIAVLHDLQQQLNRANEEIRRLTRGQTTRDYDGHHDADLILELIARGYVVHKPLEEYGDD